MIWYYLLMMAVLIFVAGFVSWALVGIFGAMPVPSNNRILTRALGRAKGILAGRKKFADLGSGTGKAMLAIWKKIGIPGIGYEISPVLFLASWMKFRFRGRGNLKVRFASFFGADLGDYDLLYVYFRPSVLRKVRRKLDQASPGTIVVSYAFPLYGSDYVKRSSTMVYFYRKIDRKGHFVADGQSRLEKAENRHFELIQAF